MTIEEADAAIMLYALDPCFYHRGIYLSFLKTKPELLATMNMTTPPNGYWIYSDVFRTISKENFLNEWREFKAEWEAERK